MILTGEGEPYSSLGEYGNLYLDVESGKLYQKSEIWEYVADLKGAVGETGHDGDAGLNGKDGLDGKDGSNGINGIDGINGVNGKDGIDGRDGKDGRCSGSKRSG